MDLTSLVVGISWIAQALAIFFAVVCLFLIVIVLLQKGRGAGLASAFGGAGGQSAFGSKTGDVFTWVTIVAAAMFLLLAMVVSVVYKDSPSKYETPAISQPGATAPAPDADAGAMPDAATDMPDQTGQPAAMPADQTAATDQLPAQPETATPAPEAD